MNLIIVLVALLLGGYLAFSRSLAGSSSFSGVAVDYSQYTVDLGYRVLDNSVKFDIVGGYRLVNFGIDIENGQNIVKTSFFLAGPFLGINVAY